MSYRNLEIWQFARAVSIEIHHVTLECLPKFEMYEEASQIRRSAKSIRSNVVEGYGRRRYKLEFIRFLRTCTRPVMRQRTIWKHCTRHAPSRIKSCMSSSIKSSID